MVNFVPKGHSQLTTYLSVSSASDAIAFYIKAFGAKEISRFTAPNGKIPHADIQVGNTVVMLSDELPDAGLLGPNTIGGTPVTLYLFVEDADATFAAALQAGAEALRPVQDHFFGDRAGQVLDPFGHRWTIATHIEDVAADEYQRRASDYMSKQS